MRAALAALALLSCAEGAIAQQQPPAPAAPPQSAQEKEAKEKLAQVREQIGKITREQRETSAQRSDVTGQLRASELSIAQTAKELRAIEGKLAGQQARVDDLTRQRDALDVSLAKQRDALAALLRSAYALGRDEELRLLLMQDDVESVGRLLAYYRYFERARVGEIDRLLGDLAALGRVQADLDAETARLAQSRDERAAEAQRLAAERDTRRQALAALEATLKDQQSRLAALGRDEKGLLDLLAKLRDIFADIPKQIAGAEPFSRLRGRLSWPLRGTLAAGSGEEGDGHGILISAAEGGEVHAVSHGRVAFADWLRGYGLLLIIDHGDGYLSLYGCNETLLKDVGDWVDAGELIATSGASGGRNKSGLYFELRHDGKPMDARAWLRPSSQSR
jgi:septal ring factor EnvC (AmiA/AmiB activator)